MCLQELHLKCRRVPADAARALTGPEVRGSEEFRWNCGFPTVVHIGEHNTTPLARGYRRGYFVTLQLALIEHSIVCKRLRIRPGEPSEDVPGLPGTSATVQRIGAHLANPNRYVFRQHPDFHQQLMLGGGISGGIGDSFRTDTPRIARRMRADQGNAAEVRIIDASGTDQIVFRRCLHAA
jgi:hypothetical protein